jgi:hypothetical protein
VANEIDSSGWLEKIATAVRQADPRAFLVPPRILRRVIKTDRALPGLGFRIPHRKSYVLSGTRVKYFVDKDELGLSVTEDFPAYVFLLSEPKESELAGMTFDEMLRWAWRLLFHARVHFELDRMIESGELPPSRIRACVDRIGQVEFDEVQSVLAREHFLMSRADRSEVFEEFCAVYWEYRFFAPHRLPWYFPSLTDFTAVESVLRDVLDPARLLDETRLVAEPAAAEPDDERRSGLDGNGRVEPTPAGANVAEAAGPDTDAGVGRGSPNVRRYMKHTIAAGRAESRGNTVRAAIQYYRAAPRGTDAERSQAEHNVAQQLDHLTERLRAALQFDETQRAEWREVLGELLRDSIAGFWNADRKMLSDLQKVCVDHERDVYKIDLLEWAFSRGKRPIKRRLPYQREVLIVKHLRTAVSRLKSIRVAERHRETLSRLLRSALDTEERVLRERMRPVIAGVLQNVGFRPGNPPEQVSFHRLIEEFLDGVVKHGYANMGTLRDAVSRNWLKLEDLSGPREFLSGDKLLQADRKLSVGLDGVYRAGEFYLRWLQRISSAAFGTKLGRWLTLFVLLPFGGTYMILRFFEHLLENLPVPAPHLTGWETIVGCGVFALALIHSPPFRVVVGKLLAWLVRAVGAVLIDLPVWAVRSRTIRALLRSPPVVFLRRFVLVPVVLTVCFCFGLPALGLYGEPGWIITGLVYVLLTGIINSRMGRDVEELTADWVEHTWFQLRTRVVIAVFEWVMSVFHKIIEVVERFLYAVAEWLRFRSGESQLMLGVKAVFGVAWAIVSFVLTFAVTLLIEPQINPIKHFPVVTVSHKIILPTGLPGGMLSQLIEPLAGSAETANAVAASIVWLIPGIFGFLVWELRSNWRLYLANRPETLRPVMVGDHGETMLRLLKPGFHSGTVPRLFGRIRRAVRKQRPSADEFPGIFQNPRELHAPPPDAASVKIPPKYAESLHHVEHAVRHFVERHFIAILETTCALEGNQLRVGEIRLASNNLQIEISGRRKTEDGDTRHSLDSQLSTLNSQPLVIVFQEQSGRLISGVLAAGWLAGLDEHRRTVVGEGLAGLYAQSGVDMVREQIVACVPLDDLRYDIEERSLVLWPDPNYEVEVRYELEDRTRLVPRPKSAAREYALPVVSADDMIFGHAPIAWQKWTDYWTAIAAGNLDTAPAKLVKFVLPPTSEPPAEARATQPTANGDGAAGAIVINSSAGGH